MSKDLGSKVISLTIPAGNAKPAPPVGPVLAQNGVSVPDFCKQFNDRTKNEEPNTPLRVEISCNKDRTFSFIIKLPSVAFLLKKAMGESKGLSKPGMVDGPSVSNEIIRKVAEQKMSEMRVADLEAAMQCVRGTARSMGFSIEG